MKKILLAILLFPFFAFADSSNINITRVGGQIPEVTAGALPVRIKEGVDFIGYCSPKYTNPNGQSWKSGAYTTTQTGTAIWTPDTDQFISIDHLEIATKGSTGGQVIIWCGAAGDSTYSEGTDQVFTKASYVPGATAKPGLEIDYSQPKVCATNYELKITTDAAISVDVIAYGTEILD